MTSRRGSIRRRIARSARTRSPPRRPRFAPNGRLKRLQLALEDVAQIRHAIWKRTLASQPDGVEAPQSLMQGLEGRGVPIDQFMPDKKITASLLEGAFRFKAHGSVDTADPSKRARRLDRVLAGRDARSPAFSRSCRIRWRSGRCSASCCRRSTFRIGRRFSGVRRRTWRRVSRWRSRGGDAAGDGDAGDATGHAAECGDGGRPAAGHDAAAESRGDAAVHQYASVMCCTAICYERTRAPDHERL
jgi:hypothetical protein